MDRPKVVMVVEGGVLRDVIADCEIEFIVVDHDVQGNDPKDLVKIEGQNAYVYTSETIPDPDTVDKIFVQFDQQTTFVEFPDT
jgi:hypothetical protein